MGSKTRRDPGAAAPRGRRRRWLIVSGIGLVVLALAGFGLYQFVLKPNATAATFTRTATAATQTVQTTVGTTGTLEPKRQADLSFSSSGTVTKVYVKVGDRVAKGEVLARIDDASLKADVAAAKADVQAAQSTLSDLQDNDDSTATAIASATAQLKLKNNALSQARSALKAAALRSTIKGTVAEVDIAKGDQVGSSSGSSGSSNSSSSSSSSSSAITVISTNRYVVSTSVGSADLSKVKVGLQAVITPTGATDSIYGTVATVGVMASSSSSSGSGTSSSSTASFPVTIEVTEAQKNLFAGASATVSIIVEQRDNVLVVPTAAITTANGKTVVQKLVNGSPVETEVTVGSTYGSQTEITKGLSAGDEVQISFARQTTTGTRSGSGTGNQNGGGGFGGGTFGGGGGFGAGGGGFGGGSGGQGGFTRTGQGG